MDKFLRRKMKREKKYRIGRIYLGGIILSSTLMLYGFGLAGLDFIAQSKACPLKDKKHAEQILKREQKKLGIEDKKIELILEETLEEKYKAHGAARKVGPNSYQIFLIPKELNDSIIKHEVYHIADGHCDSQGGVITYFFYYEPQARLYAAFGIEL